ncbi:ABC-2 type transport system permease protein [Planifilum fimeticola]|jgi:ABC-2 type transport system permease protein|uniref:ABC-2 type transport system permease protein n=1 Tax=Planifilum fimeticola TaxID=201975 RepID=A0A2T0LAZ1_9BACL|nr:ABC transporter permease [Planifilum fimeticola]PRX39028.1 ABC-2 type transport system permease protein [Planifilum fimeticola]
MKAYFQLTKAQLLLFARNRNIVIWTLFFPIFMMLALGMLVGDGMGFQVRVAVADEDDSAASRQFVGELGKTEGIDLIPSSDGGGGEMVRSGEADLVVVVKKGFGQRVASPEEGETARLIALYYDKGNPTVAEVGTALIRQMVDRLNKRLVRFQPVIGVEEINVQSRPMSYTDFLVPGILSLMIMNNSLNGVAGTIASWRERGILRRMQGTPLSSATFIAGQITARILLNAVQAIAVLLVAYFAFDVHVYGSWAALIFFILLGTLTFLSIGFIIASLARSPESAGPIAGLVSFPMIFVGGIFFPIRNLPDFLQPLVEVIPIVHLTRALRDIMNAGAGLADLWMPTAALAAWLAVSFLVAAWSFRWDVE